MLCNTLAASCMAKWGEPNMTIFRQTAPRSRKVWAWNRSTLLPLKK